MTEIGYVGQVADVTTSSAAIVPLATELARRELNPDDFTVIRPSLEDAVISLLEGAHR